jgi:hypothetical protein
MSKPSFPQFGHEQSDIDGNVLMTILATVRCYFARSLAGLFGHDRLLRAASMYDYGSRQQREATDETDHRCTDKDEEKPGAFFGY